MIIRTSDIGEMRETPIGEMEILDIDIVRHDSGKPFVRYLLKDLLQMLAEDMQKNVSADYDNIVIVEGGEGSGKSNWTWDCAHVLNPNFDFEKQLVYGIDALKKKLVFGDDKHSIFWMDEAYDIANKRDWNTEKNKLFVSLLVKMRSRGWTLMMDVPRYDDMDVYIRDHRARYCITCAPCQFKHYGYRERGFFEAKKRDKLGRWRHIGYGLYDPMPPEVDAQYSRIKESAQDETLKSLSEEGSSPGAKYRAMYENQSKRLNKAVLMLRDSGVSREYIMETLGISKKTYYNMIEKGRKVDDFEEDD